MSRARILKGFKDPFTLRDCEFECGSDITNSQFSNRYSLHFCEVGNNVDGNTKEKVSLSQSLSVNGPFTLLGKRSHKGKCQTVNVDTSFV